MNTFLIGNLISGIGCLVMVGIGLLRKQSHILLAQCVQCCFMGLGNLILGGISGFICNMVTIVRNLVLVRFPITTWLKVLFILLQLALSLGSLGDGIISWLPLISAALFIWFLDTPSATRLKVVMLISQVMWLTYDLYYRNYVTSAFDVMTMCSNVIALVMIQKEKK